MVYLLGVIVAPFAGMFVGRFVLMVLVLALAGSLANKPRLPPGRASFPVDGTMFAMVLGSVIIIVGALTFAPALLFGPIVEQLMLR